MVGGAPYPRSDLFQFDRTALKGDILVHDGVSKIDYHEYAVFKAQDGLRPASQPGNDTGTARLREVSHSITSDHPSSGRLFDLALKEGHGLNSEGEFVRLSGLYDPFLEGRVRHVICHRRVKSDDGSLDGLSITDEDFELLDLHPATLQYLRRTTTESMSWDRQHEKLSLIMSFSSDPRPPFDYMSMTYNITTRLTTVLIRQSYDPYHHELDDIDEYSRRMEACRSHWSHPLVTPVVLLQVQFARAEKALVENNIEVNALEQEVGTMAGFEAYERRERQHRRMSGSRGGPPVQEAPAKKTTPLMKAAHDVLKRAIQLLDTVHWMERAVKILMDAGDALSEIISDPEDTVPSSNAIVPLSARGRAFSGLSRERIRVDPFASHWHEIRQYLEGLLQLCMSLGTDRHMLELRCKAQIDIIYSKMAQEDNNLNVRMAVASTRDSSSMKALAVITALFLPGDFIGTLFGMSMFEWGDVDDSNNGTAKPGEQRPDPVVTGSFWIYWSVTIPLTITILCVWRAWWVAQDRHFRKHLSRDLSEERFWTDDGRPRALERSFLHDFFYLSVRRDERGHDWNKKQAKAGTLSASTTNDQSEEDRGWEKLGRRTSVPVDPSETMSRPGAFRLRQIAFAKADKRENKTYV